MVERHNIVNSRQTDFGFGVDARAGPGNPSSPDMPLPVRSSLHDLCHGWDLPWWLPAAMCSRSPNSYFLPFDEGFHIIKQCASDTIN